MRPSRPFAAIAAVAALTLFSAEAQAKPKAKANLKIQDVTARANVVAGGPVSVEVEVRNRGKKGGRANVTVTLRSSGETPLGSASTRVPPRQTRSVSVNGTAPAAGSYTPVACVPKGKKGKKGKRSCRSGDEIKITAGGGGGGGQVPPPKNYTPGSRSLGDPLFPQTGNGGYDARSYDIELDYDPVANVLDDSQTTMTATATQDLSAFSLDFQMTPTAVRVNGAPATFTQPTATPQLPAPATPLRKLVVTPARPIDSGSTMTVEVEYEGTPVRITDVDGSYEGWIPACYGPGQTAPCDGGFVVNEPNGAQGWFPSNNYPTDKATFDTTVTVPTTHTALGIGELSSRVENGDGTWTWSWSEDTPAATYLTTATVGLFNYSLTSMIETSTNRALPIYNAIDSSYVPPASTNLAASLEETDEQLNYLSDLYGPYPLDSYGSVVDRTTDVFYALEVQTKSHYSQISSITQDISASTQLHETAHQWWGNTVTLERWQDIWFQEGFAQWSEWIWAFDENGGPSPEAVFDDLYATVPADEWEIAPAVLDNDPVNLFATFPTYDRGAMVIQATREIIGEPAFRTLTDRLLVNFRYGNISTQEFIAVAKEVSGFSGAQLDLLDEFYDQWLYGETKPTILPEDF